MGRPTLPCNVDARRKIPINSGCNPLPPGGAYGCPKKATCDSYDTGKCTGIISNLLKRKM